MYNVAYSYNDKHWIRNALKGGITEPSICNDICLEQSNCIAWHLRTDTWCVPLTLYDSTYEADGFTAGRRNTCIGIRT